MSIEQLEQRVTALEKELAELRGVVTTGPSPYSRWWEKLEPIPEELLPTFEAMVEYGRYFRKTGKEAPPDWKPGDPIPEPEFDE